MAYNNESWEGYEHRVHDLLRGKLVQWFPHISNSAVKVYGKRSLPGATGIYEIDASAEVHLKDLRLLFVVECKFWNSRVPQDVVLSLKSKVEDLGAHKGIIVSRRGFQSGAVTVAQANGIALWHYDPGPPTLFESMVAIIDWEAVISQFQASCIKWIRGIRYNPASWHFHDNMIPWPIRLATLPAALKTFTASLWPVWIVRLFKGRRQQG